MKKTGILTLVMMTLLVAGIAIAEKHGHEHGRKKHYEGRCRKGPEAATLEKNVQLTFRSKPNDDDDKDLVITVGGSPGFRHKTRYESEDGEFYFAVEGSVELQDEKKVFLKYAVTASYEGEGEETEFHIGSGAVLVPGKEITLGTMHDKTFSVKMNFPDDMTAKKKKASQAKKKKEQQSSKKQKDKKSKDNKKSKKKK